MELGDLTEGERRLWAAFPRGVEVDLGGPDPTGDGAVAEDWGPEHQVRAEVLTRLLLGMAEAEPGHAARLALTGARVVGQLDITGATVAYGLYLERCWLDEEVEARNAKTRLVNLVRCRVPALLGFGLHVDGPVGLTGSRLGFVGLTDATIAGRLQLTGSTLSIVDRYALLANRLTVAHSVLCRDLTATGEVRLLDARVGGALLLSGARFSNPGGVALHLHGIRVDQSVDGDKGFVAVGDVRLSGARIAGQLLVAGDISGALDLSDAQVQTVRLASSPAPATRLDGLTYGELKPDEPAAARLGWLRRDPDGYRSQPYEQLAGHYRRLGHDGQARRVLLAKRRAYRASMPAWRRAGGLVMDALAGYGYAPERALAWLAGAWLAGWWYFAAVAQPDLADPGLYALDVLIPTSPLGLEGRYTLDGPVLWAAAGLQALGWALSLAVLPAVTRALNRN